MKKLLIMLCFAAFAAPAMARLLPPADGLDERGGRFVKRQAAGSPGRGSRDTQLRVVRFEQLEPTRLARGFMQHGIFEILKV